MFVKKTAKAILLGMLLVFLVVGGCAKNSGEVVAEVNGIKLTREQLQPRVDQIKSSFEMQGFQFEGEEGAQMLALFEQEALKQLIMEVVMQEEAKKQNIKITAQEIQENYDQIVEMYGPEAFKQILQQQNMTEQQLEDEIELMLVQRDLFELVTADVQISEAQIEEYYQAHREDLTQYRASHILIMPDEDNDDEAAADQEAKTKAEALIVQLNEGADFAALAKEYSADGSAATGGDLGAYFTKADSPYVPEFTEGALSLAVGQYSSEPVESFFGYHIIKLTEKKDSLAELQDSIRERLEGQEKNRLFDEFGARAMAEADIVNYLDKQPTDSSADDEAANGADDEGQTE